jgi:hypothetical protein
VQPSSIFAGMGRYEFVGVSAWDGNYVLRAGTYNYGFNPLANLRRQPPAAAHQKVTWGIVVECPQRAVHRLDFNEALERLQSGRAAGRERLFMKLSFRHAGVDYTLHAACKYINFTHPDIGRERYIQPIIGQVLFEDNERFHIAYVAAHLREDRTATVEFLVRDMVSFSEVKDDASRLSGLFKLLDRMLFRAFLTTDEFVRIEPAPGAECELYIYS